MEEKIKILFLASNPKDSRHLRLEEEAKYIDEAVQRRSAPGEYAFYNKGAVTIRDLRRYMAEIKPNIVHFSGHGSDEDTLIFEDEEGYSKEISSDDLGTFFNSFSDHLNCVVLNACYSLKQAKGIMDNVPIVIGMNSAIPNDSAKSFSQSFYESLCTDYTVQQAFKIAKDTLRIQNKKDAEILKIHINERLIQLDTESPVEPILDDSKQFGQDDLVSEDELNFIKKRLLGDMKIYAGYAGSFLSASAGASYLMYDKDDQGYLFIASVFLSFLAAIPGREILKKRNGQTFIELLKRERSKLVAQMDKVKEREVMAFNNKFHQYIQEKIVK